MFNLLRRLTVAFSLFLMPFAVAAAQSPETVAGAKTVTVDEAIELFDGGAAFVDVRKPSDFDAGRIPGAYHLDVKTALTQEALAELAAPSDPIVFYCNGHSCLRSSKASEMAVSWGYTDVYYLRDGYPAWEAAGFPIE